MALRIYVWYLGQMIKRADPWNNRSAISRWAHVFERVGLALAGGSCGLFVAADVARVEVGVLSSPLAILAIMLYGAAGFYLGIDLPPAAPDQRVPLPLTRNTYDESANFTGEFIELFDESGKQIAGRFMGELTVHKVNAPLTGAA